LNDESRSDDIGGRNAINFPPLQLLEEAAHKQSGLIITIVRYPCPREDMHKRGLKKRLYRNVSIGALKDGQVVRVTNYKREPFARSE
jgi:hypothetical protein